ncbi:MAG TPA: YihY/virulence factor BrkB family protein [Dissulfurispiraceae bacterium]|nr:YihY/virulence factor BrkB family protein [Dissulfurispiraceae bacterium]
MWTPAKGFVRLFGRSIAEFFRDGGLMLAASISYFSMMAVLPFCLFLVAIFTYVVGHDEAFFKYFAAKLVNFFPKAAQSIAKELRDALSYRGVGTFTFVIYGLLSYQLYSSLESAINTVFKIKDKRRFISHLFISLFLITVLILFFLLSFIASSAVSVLDSLRDDLPVIEIHTITAFIIKYVLPFIMAFLTIAILYLILPKRRIRWRNALAGALTATIFMEAAKYIFTFYVVKVVRLGAVYGPLSAFIIFLLWVFYSSCIFLIGAETVHNLEARKKK